MADPCKVLLVEDDPDFVYLIRQVIDRCAALRFVGAAGRGDEGVQMAQTLRPDVVLMDINLPGGMDGTAAARAIRLSTDARVLMLTSCEQPDTIIQASRRAFASGYIFKSQCGALADTITRTAQGPTPQAAFIRELVLQTLSPAERSVATMMLTGAIDGDAPPTAATKTIANQKTSIFRKLGLRGTAELIHIFRRW